MNKFPDVSVDYEIILPLQPRNNWLIKTNEGEYFSGNDCFDFTKNISKIIRTKYEIMYQCETSNCSDLNIFEEDDLIIWHKRFYIDNYNSTPIQFYDYDWKGVGAYLKKNNLLNLNVYWTPIIYKDLKGISRLFDRFFNFKNEYSAGFIDHREYEYSPILYNNYNKSQPVIAIINNYSTNKFIEYRRKEIGIMDILAKIGALFSTFNFVFATIFKFYENNFNNYKILNKILQPIKINKEISKNKTIKEENNNEHIFSPLLNIDDDNKETKDIEIINSINNEELEDSDANKKIVNLGLELSLYSDFISLGQEKSIQENVYLNGDFKKQENWKYSYLLITDKDNPYLRIEFSAISDLIKYAISTEVFGEQNDTSIVEFDGEVANGRSLLTIKLNNEFFNSNKKLYFTIYAKENIDEKLGHYIFKYLNTQKNSDFFPFSFNDNNVTYEKQETNGKKNYKVTFKPIEQNDVTYYIKAIYGKTKIKNEKLDSIAVSESPGQFLQVNKINNKDPELTFI